MVNGQEHQAYRIDPQAGRGVVKACGLRGIEQLHYWPRQSKHAHRARKPDDECVPQPQTDVLPHEVHVVAAVGVGNDWNKAEAYRLRYYLDDIDYRRSHAGQLAVHGARYIVRVAQAQEPALNYDCIDGIEYRQYAGAYGGRDGYGQQVVYYSAGALLWLFAGGLDLAEHPGPVGLEDEHDGYEPEQRACRSSEACACGGVRQVDLP